MAPWEPDPDADADAVPEEEEAEAESEAETVLKGRPETIALAWLRLTVVVLAEFEEEPLLLSLGGEDDEPEPGEEPPLVRMSSANTSTCTSMKVIRGPAIRALLCLSTAWPFRGWSSDVIQMATAPLIPWGTTHPSIGREREKGMPPVSIWQWNPCEFMCESSAAIQNNNFKCIRRCCC
jgi:hypothetical protein